MTDVLLPIALAVIMGTLGLSLTPDDFRRVFANPRGVAIGLGNLILVSPLLGFAIAELFGLDPVLAVGLVLLAASPGGTLANLLTHLAKGETALSVTMTAVSSVMAVLTVPIALVLAVGFFDADVADDVSTLGVAARVFLITIVPLSIGMRYRYLHEREAIELEPKLKRAAMLAFVLVVAGAVASEWDKVTDSFGEVAPAAVALNVTAMTFSFTVARLVRLSDRQSTAIAMELGVHNSTVTIAVATSINDELAIPGAVYSVFMFITAGAFAAVMARRNTRAAAAEGDVAKLGPATTVES